jgi:DNA-binding NtrC family response regulator
MSETVTVDSALERDFNMPGAKRTILIIDDDRSILRVFTRVFEKKGYSVVAVETGKKAKDQIRHHRFDAALIDVRLPDMNGTDLLSEIQARSPKTVKIVFTGSPTVEFSSPEAEKNMDAFFIKPVKPEVLLSILDEKLKSNNDGK